MDQDQMEGILNISRTMALKREVDPLLNYVVDKAMQLVGAERGFVVLRALDGALDFRVKRDREGNEIPGAEDQISTTVLKEVVDNSKPLVLRDAMSDERFGKARSVHILELRSIMCVPLIVVGDTIGAIYVENRSIRGRFRDENVIPLVLFANQAATAILNARLFEQAQQEIVDRKRAEETEREQRAFADALRRANAAINTTLNYEQVIDLILEQMQQVVPHDDASVMVLDDDVARVFRWHGDATKKSQEYLDSVQIIVSESPTLSRMHSTGSSLIIPDTGQSSIWIRNETKDWIRSYAGAPISSHDRIIGFLNVNSASAGFYSEEHANRLRVFADQAAVAIENASLYHNLEERVIERTAELASANKEIKALNTRLRELFGRFATKEVADKKVGRPILIDKTTRDALGDDVQIEEHGVVELKGKTQGVHVFSVAETQAR